MTQLPGFLCRQDLQEEVINEIVRSVKGMFLLSQLHLDSLRGKTSVQAVRKAIAKLQSGSDVYYHAYDPAMERIQSQMSDHRDLALRVLSWITCAKRPLTVEELRHALAVEVSTIELDKDAMPEIDIMVQFKSGHCLNEEDFSKRLQLNPLFHYASKNWGHHARNTTTICEGILDFLESNSSVQASAQALLADERGHAAIAQLLLENGANANSHDHLGHTPLAYAIGGKHKEVCDLLSKLNPSLSS
ncbi:hypothetical protein HG530_013877 [Fusarium avenaceum]|nr:hypothetical protein HG530_013877 [Fusarium avenaceum]